ncbi:DNA alkylation repair protein [Paenibacillus phyllosphaerae]|nr:DNA alkylation repair protein [Paenibacillus phyllosphaerae]
MGLTYKQTLIELAEEEYRQFSAALIPNISNLLGVRLPALRRIAKQIAQGDWRTYLAEAESDYFEEVMLQGMVIGCVKTDVDEWLGLVASFVPKIDNWSVCDSFCIGLKQTKAHKEQVWDFLLPYLQSDKTYEIRFGVVMLLDYYVEDDYILRVLELLDQTKRDDYYVQMAVAWALSICYIHYPEPTLRYMASCSLDHFTYNKAIQKMIESLRVDADTKQMLRGLKRK